MKQKIAAIALMAALMTVLMAMSVSAGPTCTFTWGVPAATGETLTGSDQEINVSVGCDAGSDDGNATAVYYEYKLTTASSWTALNATNATNQSRPSGATGFRFHTKFNTLPLYDHLTYQIKVTAYNYTGDEVGTDETLAALYADNHVPKIDWITSITNNKEFKFPVTLKTFVRNATSCTFQIWDSDVRFDSYTGTYDGTTTGSETCSYTWDSNDFPNGIKRFVKVTGVDLGSGPDTTTSSYDYIMFSKEMSNALKASIDEDLAAPSTQGTGTNFGKLALAALVIYGIYYVFAKRK